MFRKLLALIVLAAAIWLGARYFAHRGEIRFTVVFHEAGAVRKGDPVVENGQIVIRPMNYLALSYDHRIIDGREAVLSLVAMKDALEDPARLLLDL